ncbi:MAG: NAD(P)H-dependent oxidoreductase [Cyanobacteria bacterium]|nr:NAD(P)H-dependent oxidoreductase [Cyanobacteriota bacterium]
MEGNYLIISSSLNKDSRSRALAREAERSFSSRSQRSVFLDLTELELPLCDGDSAYSHPNVAGVTALVENASAVIVALPVYNYAAGAAIKNFVELTGRAWNDKVVAFLCAAGGKSSYMSVMGLANSLMLDFRCLIVPRFVYADSSSFAGSTLVDEKMNVRIDQLVTEVIRIGSALSVTSVPLK